VGIVANHTGPSGSKSESAGGSATSTGTSRQSNAMPALEDDGKGRSSPAGVQKGLEAQRSRSLAKQAKRFGVVVVARAAKVVGDLQRFTVVRRLKGDAPDVLRLGTVGEPAKVGALHVLFLDPVASPKATPTADGLETPRAGEHSAAGASAPPMPGEASTPGSASAGPSTAPSPRHVSPVLPRSQSFRFGGARVVVRRLPRGFDFEDLRLP
jgi:hypothetical protein